MQGSARVPRITFPVVVFSAFVAAAAVGADQGRTAVPANPDDKTIIHVLNRIGFGPGPGDVERVRKMGLASYIDQQLRPERLADTAVAARLNGFTTLAKSTEELSRDYFMPAQMERRRAQRQAANNPEMKSDAGSPDATRREMRTPEQIEAMQAQRQVMTELMQQKVIRAAYSERQLDEVMVDFWFNHFNVFVGKGQVRVYLSEYERDAIRPRALGTFRDLLGAVAESPAMLFYLDNWQSAAPEGARTEAARPNPADRARMRPGQRGRGGRPPVGQPRTLADVPARPNQPNQRARGLNENYARELMELHTLGVDGGYTQKDVQEVARALTGWTIANPRQGGGFRYEPRMHDDGEKIVLGHRIKAGGGRKDGEQVLDILAAHPSTAQFIATKLARRFVADQPPKPLVDRAAARFRETNGDIREVVRTIVTSPEFFAAEAYRAKVKSPLEFVVSAVRATGADAANAMPLVQAMQQLGMPLYGCQPPTGYPDRADAWVNTGALLNRMNFAVSLTSARGRGIRSSGAMMTGDLATVRDSIIDRVLGGEISESTRSTVDRATQPQQAVALLLGSPEFQKR
jgi:uncharacterized protein (DUF1800 family)